VKLAASQQLFSYWNHLRGARSAPERNDIDPGAIRGVLADTFILEFDTERAFPARIVGTRTNALFLRELRGAPFLHLWREEDREEMRSVLESVADEAQPFLIGATGTPPGFAPIDIEVLLLPLRHHGDTHARILGACAPKAPPSWLGLLALESLTLQTLRALRRRDRDAVGRTFAAATPPGLAREPSVHRYGHLFVYSANR
jgi:hypothetical protein